MTRLLLVGKDKASRRLRECLENAQHLRCEIENKSGVVLSRGIGELRAELEEEGLSRAQTEGGDARGDENDDVVGLRVRHVGVDELNSVAGRAHSQERSGSPVVVLVAVVRGMLRS